jgi:hypothetical protein
VVEIGVWTQLFNQNFDELYGDEFAKALESDYVLIESVDRMDYDPGENTVTLTATTDYQSIYEDDREEWLADAWEVFRDYGREWWTFIMEGLEGQVSSWEELTPGLNLTFNKGALSVTCPGAVIYAISQRSAAQEDWEAGCAIKP